MLEVDTKYWGKYFWYILHFISLNIENEHVDIFRDLIFSLEYILPCPVCREHFSKLLKKNNYIYSKKDDCNNILFNIHNKINNRLNNLVYDIEVLKNYKNYKKFYKNVIYITNILLNHDKKVFNKLKIFFKIICLLDIKSNHLLNTIPDKFEKNNLTLEWIYEFKKNIIQ
jgi:hypothetical protein